MLVFGDRERSCDPRAAIDELVRALDRLCAGVAPGGPLVRHGALAAAFVDASELAQGLADAASAPEGPQARTALGDAAMRVLVTLAGALARSWDGRPTGAPALAAAREALAALAARPLPASIRPRTAEGHAYYALYPEAYLEAARAATAAAPGPRHVIGIRSIGAGLAAIVAAACEAPLPATVRPRGDPHRRRVAVDAALAGEWARAAAAGATLAIADEGPGLSGSSFGAVIDALAAAGVPEARLELYPGHAGEPGPAAAEDERARWRRLRRRTCPGVAARVAERALIELAGPLEGPAEDVSAGAWRAHRFAREGDWPPVVAYQERYKLLARAGGARWLAKFAGLGRAGEHALARARTLAAAGFGPEVAGLCHGFHAWRWLEDATPLDPARVDRAGLVEHVARYLGFRRRAFPADGSRGAGPAALLEMLRRNAGLALGEDAAAAAERWRPALAELAARAHPIEVDARMHAWEWLALPGGRLVKTDAVDHHAGHDLIGCQDVAWDVAGAIVELALTPAEARRLAARVGTGRELLAFLHAAYLAFQLGRHALAIGMAAPADAARLRSEAERYTGLLRAALTAPGAAM
jgi:hypothetical protein